jgi:hypothetical protein
MLVFSLNASNVVPTLIILFKNMKKLLAYSLIGISMALVGGISHTAQAIDLGPNLIQNPSFESGAAGSPTGWTKDRWANNTGVFAHPVTGVNGGKAVQVTITSRTSGDAKWVHADVPITGGKTYQFSDYSLSNATTVITLRYKLNNNSNTYVYLGSVSPSAQFKQNTFQFTAPANAVAVTVFHLIGEVGNLSLDEYSLNEVGVTVPPPPTPTTTPATNLIVNGDLETTVDGLPFNWVRDRWNNDSAVFTYPVVGVNGSKAVKLVITTQTNGDAKWIPEQIPVEPGATYTYTDQFMTDSISNIMLKFQGPTGPYSFYWIKTVPPSPSTFTTFTHQFTVPAGQVKVTVYHYINNVGYFTLDNAVLVKN